MKKLLSLFVILLVTAISLTCFAADVKMTDVDYATDLGKSIEKLVNAGVISGIPQEDGTLKYEASNPVTRAEFCKMVNVTFNYEVMKDNIFTDVNPSQWYYVHVLRAINEGYISGYDDGRFGGEDFITREQVCTILSRIVNKTAEGEVEIKDTVSGWALPYVKNIVALGYMNLEGDGKFRATENMTRGELAQTLDDFVVIKQETVKPSEDKPSSGSNSSIGVKPSIGGGSSGGSSSGGGGSSSGGGGSSSGGGGSSSGSGGSSSGSGSGSSGGSTTEPEPEPEPTPEVEYSITYEINGIGELPESAKTVYTASGLPYTLPVLAGTRDYVFDGWYKDSSFSGEAVKRIEAGTAENLTFYANWIPRYTEEELQTSEDIYNSLEFALTDIQEKEELEVFEFDEKGQTIFEFLKTCSSEVYSMKDTGFVVSNSYVRSHYQEQIKSITDILDGMTVEERDAFEFEVNKLNTMVLKDLVDLFDVNINYGK